jgi:hypothetical protein
MQVKPSIEHIIVEFFVWLYVYINATWCCKHVALGIYRLDRAVLSPTQLIDSASN